MISIEDYKKNPCGSISIPYWKAEKMSIPDNIKIVHNNNFDQTMLNDYNDKKYFRLFHNLKNVPTFTNNNYTYGIISKSEINELVKMINTSYTHTDVFVSTDYINGLTKTEAYCPELWIGAFDNH